MGTSLKTRILIILIACALLSCAKSLTYSVIKSAVTSWSFVDGGGVNFSASNLTAETYNNQLYLFYAEPTTGVGTSFYQGNFSNWQTLSTFSVQATPVTIGAPSVTTFNSKIYGIWTEVAKSGAFTGNPQNHVAYSFGNGLWSVVDPPSLCGGINCLSNDISQSSTNPVITNFNSKLYAAWAETTATAPGSPQIKAAVYNGSDSTPNWSTVVNSTTNTLNRDPAQAASLPQFGLFNSKLYASWSEFNAPVYPGPSANTSMTNNSGNIYVFFSDTLNGGKGTVVSNNNGNWNTLGQADFTPGGTSYNSIATDNSGNIYVAFQDAANSNSVTVMKFINNGWVIVGQPGFTNNSAQYISLAIDPFGAPYVAFEDANVANKVTVMKFSSNTWTAVGGAGISAGTGFSVSLTTDSTGNLYVAYEDGNAANAATVQEFTAGAWNVLQSAGFSVFQVQFISLKISPTTGDPYISYEDSGNGGKATVQKYHGGVWTPVGVVGFTPAQAFYTSLAFDPVGTPYIAFEDASAGNKASVMKFSAAWIMVESGISSGSAGHVSLVFDPVLLEPVIAYEDTGLGNEVSVKESNGASFQPLSNVSASQIRFAVYNGNDVTPQWSYIDGGNDTGINYNKSLSATSSAFGIYQGKLYLAWLENNGTTNQVRVAVYGGNDAAPNGHLVDGNGPNGLNYNTSQNATGPLAVSTFFNQLYISWSETDSLGGAIRVKVYNGNDNAPQWTFVDGGTQTGLDSTSGVFGQWPNLTVFNNNLYSTWVESTAPAIPGVIHAAIGN